MHTFYTDDISILKHHLACFDGVCQHFEHDPSVLGKFDGDDSAGCDELTQFSTTRYCF